MARLSLRRKAGQVAQGWLRAGLLVLPAALGRGGIAANKHEGDGATPRGTFRLKRLWWRADRHPRPRTLLPIRAIGADDGWCEDPTDRRYNLPVRLAPAGRTDRLRRNDALYDFVIELDYNTRPRVKGRGSAVFIHVAKPGFMPTAGCIALALPGLRRLLTRLSPRSKIMVE